MSNANTQDKLSEWLSHVQDEELLDELRAMRDAEDPSAVNDAFFQDLGFGTAGLRGIIGAGTNRMNIHTVGRATQGFADYLNATFAKPAVAIARDSRNKGELFVKVAAGVLAANGVHVYVYPRIEPTPALSWAVRDLGCSGGICMTASHNPAPYNGYKAYGPDGCQITTEAARAISAAIGKVDTFEDVRSIPFEEALASGVVEWIGEDVLDRYIDAVAAQSVEPVDTARSAAAAAGTTEGSEEPSLKLVYTPLNGTGLECVSRILDCVGVTDVIVVPEQEQPDGDFPTCPYPNPEIREALQRGLELCERAQPDLLIATDPDADRVGIAVRSKMRDDAPSERQGESQDDQRAEFTLLSGNEVGVLLLDYVARKRMQRGEDLNRAVAVTTIVSSAMVDALAAEYGFEVRRTLTGFKYIGEVIGQLEAAGEEDRFLFGFEESYGYLSGPHVRDKDAVNASMLICQMALDWKRRGFTLVQAMRLLYERHGFFHNRTISLEYPGAEGSARMTALMAALRENAPSAIGECAVTQVTDYALGVNGLPASDVLQFDLAGGNKLIVRPSGTEPKIKLYAFAKGKTAASADALLERLLEDGRALLT